MPEFESLLCVRSSVVRPLRTEVRLAREENREPNTAAARLVREFFRGDVIKPWRQPTIGPNNILFFHELLKPRELDAFDDLDPGFAVVVWAGDADGVPRGVHRFFRENGTERITGTPMYPKDEQVLGTRTRRQLAIQATPDIVTYDENGNETSRTRPTAPAQTHSFWGWASGGPGRLWRLA